MNRRSFFKTASLAALGLKPSYASADETTNSIVLFEKPLQPLSAEELATMLAEIGFNGIEATVRNGGRIEPERAKDDLPELAATLSDHGLKIAIMATSINRADQPHVQDTLRAAAKLGIKRYRLAGMRYGPQQADPAHSSKPSNRN